jgi:hypothetical protein
MISKILKIGLLSCSVPRMLRSAAALRGVVRCQAGVVTEHSALYGPGSAAHRQEMLHRVRDTMSRLTGYRTRHCADGYRFAKRQGKPNSENLAVARQNKRFCDFARCAIRNPFRFDSSRTLNCSSNLIGHDHPNQPADGGGE